jgi:hypothetical protein
MNRRLSFDDALNASIDAIVAGRPMDAALDAHARFAPALRPLLETVSAIGAARPALPEPARLASNYAPVRDALRDARIARDGIQRAPANAGWMQRRVAFASLSLPAVAVAALAIMGAGGAAAATLAVTQPGVISRAADAVTPDWVQEKIPALPQHDGTDGAQTPENGDAPGITGANESPSAADTPSNGDVIDVTGVVSDSHGDTFTLTAGDATWRVVHDHDTAITGEILDGATATVHGRTAGITLHADSISASGGDPGDGNNGSGNDKTPAPGDAPGNSGDAPGHSETPPGNSGDAPGHSETPPGNSGNAPGQSETPPGNSGNAPGQSSTPPGNSGDAPGQSKTPDPGGGPRGQSGTPPGNSGSAHETKTPPGQGNANGGGPKKP